MKLLNDDTLKNFFYEDIKNVISSILKKEADISANTPLSDIGIDSLRYVELVIELEKQLGIKIDDNDLIIDNFRNIESIQSLIGRYRQI